MLDLYIIRHQASIHYATGQKTLMCECRSISRTNWLQQAATVGTIKKSMLNPDDEYHHLKAATLDRQAALNGTRIDEEVLAGSESGIK